MNPLCRRALLAVWTLTSIYPYLGHCLTLTITNNKQLYPGGKIDIDSSTTASDPAQANLYVYDTSKGQSTQLWTGWPAPTSPHSIFTIPDTVTPGTTYVIRATTTDGNTVLTNSATFQIFANAAAASSGSGNGNPSTTTTSSTTSSTSTSTSSPPPPPTTSSTTNTSTTSNGTNSTSLSAQTGSGTPAPSHSSPPLGAIIGGVLGGLALIAIILAVLLLLRRRKPAKPAPFLLDKAPPPETFPSQANVTRRDPTVSPFTLTEPPLQPQRAPVLDSKHPSPPTPQSGTYPSGKKGLFGPPTSATTSSGFSSRSEKTRLMAASASTSQPDVRQELEELKAQVKTLELQNKAAGLHPSAPPSYQ